MTIYAVLAPPAEPGSTRPEPDRFVFVKEGFCWPAFYLTIPWLIWRRMWLVLLAYVLALAAGFAIGGRMPPLVAWTTMVLFSVFVGLEANNLRRWTLERCGCKFLGVTVGDRLSDGEYRFFANWIRSAPTPTAGATAKKTSQTPRAKGPAPHEAGMIIGMFPTPGAQP